MLQTWIEVRVAAKRIEAADIVSLELVHLDGQDLPPFSAGAHIDVEIDAGLVRQYSLCNDGAQRDRYVIAILREQESRGGSLFLHERLNQGDVIRISEPRNHFPLQADAMRSLLFAGGIGVTPILCMAERLANTDGEFELHYCVRSIDRAAFLGKLRDARFSGRMHLHLDNGPDDQKLDLPGSLGSYVAGTHVYVCGPSGFIEGVLNRARDLGFPDSALHREYFAAPSVAVDPGVDRSFRVRIASSGETLEIPPDRTVAEVLAEAGIEVPLSCEQGVCGSCLTRVLEGRPEHRDFYQTDDEKAANDHFTPCVSRALSALLVLDL